MRFQVPALRADALAIGPRGQRSSAASHSSAAPSLALAHALAHSTARSSTLSTSVHLKILPSSESRPSPPRPTPSTASGHGIIISIQNTAQPGLYDFLGLSGDEWDHLDPRGLQTILKNSRDRAADENDGAGFDESQGLLFGMAPR